MINILKTAARKIKTGLLLLTICFGLLISASAQDSKGTDFWVMFNTNYTGGAALTLFITSSVNTSGTVSSPAFASIPFAVTANTVTAVAIPASLSGHTSDVVDAKGIHVTSLQEVSVYGLNRIAFTTDAYLAFPTDALGTNYRIMTYQNTNVVNATEFGVVGTVNGTVVTITPSVTTGARTAGVPYNIALNQGQTYELVNGVNGGDFTGTLITATQPIGVFGAHGCANIPSGCTACDHICEMIPPTTTWGQQFVTVPLGGPRTGGDQWKFMASDNATTVSINGVAQAPVLNAGQFMERNITTTSVITSNRPILVSQFARGITCSGGVTGDPFMMLIPPSEQFLANYTITTVAGFTTHFVNLVVPNSITGLLTQDGVAIPAASFTAIGATGFSGAVIPITEGSHTYNASLPFGVFSYGWNSADSYGYTGGQSFSPIALVSSIDITPETGNGEVCNNRCWNVVVKDQFNNPVPGVRIDFTVTGVNPGLSFANTNASGIATYCYSGTAVGQDIIKASIGTLSDQSTFNWTASTLSITAGSNSPLLIGATLNLTATAGFAGYSWKDPNNVVFSSDQNPSIANVTLANSGIYTVTGTSSGGCTATGTVNVIVTEANLITCPGDIIQNIGTSCTKSIATVNPAFNGTVVTLTWTLTGATIGASAATGINYVGTRVFKAGTTTVTYTARDANNNSYSCSYIVKLTENVPPEIRCPLDKTVYADPGVCTRAVVSLGNPVVSDNCAVKSVTNNAPAVYQPGSNFVTWTVTDYSGNTRTCVQEIYVADNQRPTITCPANIIASTGPVCEATLVNTPNPVFADNCSVTRLTWAMTGVSFGTSPNTGINYVGARNFATGVSRITYAATDAAGNTQTCIYTVTVKDNTAPTLTCPPQQTLCKLPNNTYSIPLLIQSDNCDIARTDLKITGATSRTNSGTNASGIFNLGVSTITWTVKDVAGNVSTCATQVTVLPTNDPFCIPLTFTGGEIKKDILPEPAAVNAKLKKEESISGLSILAWPNPSQQYFNLKISSPKNEMVQIRMIDLLGNVVQTKKGLPGETYLLGNNAQKGIYTIEVNQAGKTVRTKVVKE